MKTILILVAGLFLMLPLPAHAQEAIKPDAQTLKLAHDYKMRQARIAARNEKANRDNMADMITSSGERDLISAKVPQGYTFNIDLEMYIKLPPPPISPALSPSATAPPTPAGPAKPETEKK